MVINHYPKTTLSFNWYDCLTIAPSILLGRWSIFKHNFWNGLSEHFVPAAHQVATRWQVMVVWSSWLYISTAASKLQVIASPRWMHPPVTPWNPCNSLHLHPLQLSAPLCNPPRFKIWGALTSHSFVPRSSQQLVIWLIVSWNQLEQTWSWKLPKIGPNAKWPK